MALWEINTPNDVCMARFKNGHRSAHGQKAPDNCHHRERVEGKLKQQTKKKGKKKEKKKRKGKYFEGAFSIGKKYFIFLRTNSV